LTIQVKLLCTFGFNSHLYSLGPPRKQIVMINNCPLVRIFITFYDCILPNYLEYKITLNSATSAKSHLQSFHMNTKGACSILSWLLNVSNWVFRVLWPFNGAVKSRFMLIILLEVDVLVVICRALVNPVCIGNDILNLFCTLLSFFNG